MTTYEPHPLDADLLDYVDGRCEEGIRALIEDHLRGCPLCRIKLQRLSGAQPIIFADVRDIETPAFEILDVESSAGEFARSGELWLTASDDAAMVLIRKVRNEGSGVVVVPVTLDIEVADSGALILDESASPLAVPIAIYDRLVSSLPFSALGARVVPSRSGMDLRTITEDTPGVTRASPLEGPADPRHEVRQYLTDTLASLEPYVPEREQEDGIEELDPRVERLQSDLDFHRPGQCEVGVLRSLPTRGDAPWGWRGLAIVRDLTAHVVVIETPRPLNGNPQFTQAQILITRLDGSALVVCSTAGDEEVDLFDVPGLFNGVELPEGGRSAAPLFTGLSLTDSVVKFLDQKRPKLMSRDPHRRQAARHVNVADVLDKQLRSAVVGTMARAARFHPGKREGYQLLGGFSESLMQTVRPALEGDFDPQGICRAVEDA